MTIDLIHAMTETTQSPVPGLLSQASTALLQGAASVAAMVADYFTKCETYGGPLTIRPEHNLELSRALSHVFSRTMEGGGLTARYVEITVCGWNEGALVVGAVSLLTLAAVGKCVLQIK